MTKKCPFCAEEIQEAAIKCKHCQSDLAPQAADGIPEQKPPVSQIQAPASNAAAPTPKEQSFLANCSEVIRQSWKYASGLALVLIIVSRCGIIWCTMVWLVLWVPALIGLFGLLSFKGKKKAASGLAWLYSSVLGTIVVCVASGYPPDQKTPEGPITTTAAPVASAPETIDTAKQQPSEKAAPNNIGCTEAQFVNRFNKQAKETGEDFKLKRSKKQSAIDSTIYTINNDMALSVFVDRPSKLVRGVLFIGQGEGTFISGAALLVGMGITMSSADPKMSPEQKTQLMKDLHVFVEDGTPTLDGKADLNGLRYEVSTSKVAPVMLSIESTSSAETADK